MIPTHLERLILDGNAKWKHVVLSHSGFHIIRVKKDTFIVITEIVFETFADLPPGSDETDVDTILNNSQHQMVVITDESEAGYVVRANVQLGTVLNELGAQVRTASWWGARTFHPYQVSKADVRVNISRLPDITGYAATPAAPNPKTKVNDPPIEYGGIATQPMVNEDLTAASIMQTTEFNQSPIAAPTSFNNSRFPVDANTALNVPMTTSPLGQRTYPIVNIGYIEVRKSAGTGILPSG